MSLQLFICLMLALAAAAYLAWDVLAPVFRRDCAPVGCSGCPKASCPAKKLQARRSVTDPI